MSIQAEWQASMRCGREIYAFEFLLILRVQKIQKVYQPKV